MAIPPAAEKSSSGSSFHLPRFNTGPRKISTGSTGRPSSSSGLKDKEKGKELFSPKDEKDVGIRDPALLRKRTSSLPGQSPLLDAATKKKESSHANGKGQKANGSGHNVGPLSPLKPGQSILDQIGEADHTGWMMKKGDRYNAWKQRYFVLKGPHMYCLKSDSHAVRLTDPLSTRLPSCIRL